MLDRRDLALWQRQEQIQPTEVLSVHLVADLLPPGPVPSLLREMHRLPTQLLERRQHILQTSLQPILRQTQHRTLRPVHQAFSPE